MSLQLHGFRNGSQLLSYNSLTKFLSSAYLWGTGPQLAHDPWLGAAGFVAVVAVVRKTGETSAEAYPRRALWLEFPEVSFSSDLYFLLPWTSSEAPPAPSSAEKELSGLSWRDRGGG